MIVVEPRTAIEPDLSVTAQINEVFLFATSEDADGWITLFQDKNGGEERCPFQFLITQISDPTAALVAS